MAQYLNGGVTKAFLTGSVNYANGGYVQAYVAGTSTPTNTYNTISDADAGINPQEWPVVLDSQGQKVIAVKGATDVFCYDADDNLLWSVLGLDATENDIFGPDGGIVLHFIYNEGAVNGWSIENSTTGVAPIISTYGADTNITGQITSKGNGDLRLDGGDTGKVILGNTSTGNIELKRPTESTSTITATTMISSDTTSAQVVNTGVTNQAYRVDGQGNLGVFAKGSYTGSYSTVPSGYIGEIIQGGPTTVTIAPSANYSLQIIDLTPGNWRLNAYGWLNVGAGTVNGITAGISTTLGSINNNFRVTFPGYTGFGSFSGPERTLHVTVTTRVYLVVNYVGTANGDIVTYMIAERYS